MELLRKLSINIELILQQTSCCSDIKYTCCCKILRHPKPHKSNTRWTKATTNCVLKIKFEFFWCFLNYSSHQLSIHHYAQHFHQILWDLDLNLAQVKLRLAMAGNVLEITGPFLLNFLPTRTLEQKWACSLINLAIDHQQTFDFYHLLYCR